MSRPIQISTHPLPFLLLLEWLLLFTVAITEALSIHFRRFHTLPSLTLISLVGFGLLGLRMPTGKSIHKILYTALEILFILFAGIVSGRGIRLFPFLYIILVIRSCLIFQLPGRIVVTSLSFVLFVLTLIHRFQHVPDVPVLQERLRFTLLSFALSFGLSLVFVLLLMNAVLAERKIREKLAIANEQLRQYALRIEDQATLQERNRIARDIHDSLGHSLTALNLQLETALKLWQSNPAKAQTFLAQAKNLGSQALREVRQSVSAMRSDPLHGQSLEAAIAALVTEFHHSRGFSPTYHISLQHPIPAEVQTAVYRVVQESLTNIWKHAAANEVKIEIQTTVKSLHLRIQDNGKGFTLNQNTTGFGLQSMRDRILALKGEFQMSSTPGAGCCITATIPLPRLVA
ncbi:integral membrane sensor signal transduction histidine kinase [Gloeocapsa sp. PCC 7428]|uniref:sensor histidine kinase n=1 Tax=Gloeocapsa sp. PCC 7428 TaxID=1173026 RepID=UPI0002A5BD53|nr:sensor histidine kinase [Gloeocapsa sp. PCC 7428]AFZ28819.1 integral membrane sensor signal transduction histidine kinase [Gloeocapsa sp. PCC 7428]